MVKERKTLPSELTLKQIELEPFYYDIRNKIINPRSIIQETRYFWNKWKPLLGPVLTILVMDLRSRCYLNLKTGEKRDYCSPSCNEIANACGVSYRTVKSYLGKSFIKSHPYLHLFLRTEFKYMYNEIYKKKVRVSNIYYVAMDDPLIPEDEKQLTILAEELLKKANKFKDLGVNFAPRSNKGVDNSSPRGKIRPYIYKAQIRPYTSNVKGTSYNTKNVKNVINKQTSNERILNNKSKIECLMEDMTIQLDDTHSNLFFKRVAELCPENLIYRALSEVKEESEMGKIKKSKGAYFTDKIKRLTKEAGITITKRH